MQIQPLDQLIVAIYALAMLGFGFYLCGRISTLGQFSVAGRQLLAPPIASPRR